MHRMKDMRTDTYCENDKDNSFISIETTSFMMASFESGVSSSHEFPSCVPVASSIMMYSEPTRLSVEVLHPYT
jgi:hypothetical protein